MITLRLVSSTYICLAFLGETSLWVTSLERVYLYIHRLVSSQLKRLYLCISSTYICLAFLDETSLWVTSLERVYLYIHRLVSTQLKRLYLCISSTYIRLAFLDETSLWVTSLARLHLYIHTLVSTQMNTLMIPSMNDWDYLCRLVYNIYLTIHAPIYPWSWPLVLSTYIYTLTLMHTRLPQKEVDTLIMPSADDWDGSSVLRGVS